MLEESDFVVKACYPAFTLGNLADYCSSTSLIEVNGISGIRSPFDSDKSHSRKSERKLLVSRFSSTRKASVFLNNTVS